MYKIGGKNMINIKLKKINEKANTPTRSSNQAAGYDLYACLDKEKIEIEPQQSVKINTGLALEIPDGYFGGIFARSGLSTKENLRPSNCVGVIDSDYRGEIIVALYNHASEPLTINHGERIAQMVYAPYYTATFVEAEELEDSVRGEGGFGSTGTK